MVSAFKRSKKGRHVFLISVLASILLVFILMWRSASEVTRADHDAAKGVMRIAIPMEPSSLDPQLVVSVEGQVALAALFEGLVVSDPRSQEPQPGVAVHWKQDESGLAYTFYLREDAFWSDGKPVVAQDFEFAFKRALRGIPCQHADQFDVLVGARAYRLGEAGDFNSVGIRVLGDHVLRLELQDPTPYFLQLITHWAWSPLPQHILERFRAQEDINTAWTHLGNLVGNGPFILKKHVRNGYYEFRRNEHYWDAAHIHLSGIHCSFKSSQNQKYAFDSGELHIATAVNASCFHEYPDLGKGSPFRSHSYLGTYYYIFNVDNEVLKDVRVRKALSLALDREAIVKNVTGTGEVAAYTLIPPDMPGYTAIYALESNEDQARSLMAEAGYPDGAGFPHLELLFNTSDGNKIMAEAVQGMWKRVLGIDVSLVNQEFKTYLDTRKRGRFAMARASWVGDYIDPYTFLSVWHKDSSSNYAHWYKPEFDALLDQSTKILDTHKRYAVLARAESLVLEEVPVMPIYYLKTATLVHPSVQGLSLDLLRRYNYKNVRLSPSR